MGMAVELVNWVRKNMQPALYGAGEGRPVVNGRGETIVVQGLPPVTELVRLGESYMVIQASAVAPVVALPTTAAQVTLWNGEPDGGRSYVLDSIFATCVVSAGAATGIGLCGMLNRGRIAAPTSDITPTGMAGHAYAGKAIVDVGATVVDHGWIPYGNSVVGPASQIGLSVDVELNGKIVIPPGGAFSIATLANTVTTITVKMGMRWHECLVDLG